jgi:DNA-binding transcriptional regulator YdaS (Cro superfamily)
MMGMAPKHPIELAAFAVGGAAKLAGLIGVSAQAIGHWKERGVPIERCVAIEQATGGVVTRRELRPNDWQSIWPELMPAAEPSQKLRKQADARPTANGKPSKHSDKPSTRKGN